MIPRTGSVEFQDLLHSEFIGQLQDMVEVAYPELLQDVNDKDEKRRATESTLWKQAIKKRAHRRIGLEWEALYNEVMIKYQRVYFLMGLLVASDFTDRLIEAEMAESVDLPD